MLGGCVSLAAAAQGARIAWAAPTYKNSRPLWRWAEASTGMLNKIGVARVNKSDRLVEFPRSGGFLGIYSMDNADAMRGEAFHVVVIDEAAAIDEAAYTDVVQPTLADYNGDLILISTPRGRNWFWREWQRGIQDMQEIAAFTAPSTANPNPNIQRAARLAQQRVPDRTYRQEWLAEFVEDGSNTFSPTWWDGQNRYHASDEKLTNLAVGRWLSWDTGIKDTDTSAYSSCVVGELQPDYRLVIREVWRDRLGFPALVRKIESMAERYNFDLKLQAVVIEDKASGTSAYQTLTSASSGFLASRVVPFMPQGSKEQRASQAGVWCANGSVLLPHPSPAVPWAYSFENELFEFPQSEYLDQVDAFSQLILFLEHYLAQGYHARNPVEVPSVDHSRLGRNGQWRR